MSFPAKLDWRGIFIIETTMQREMGALFGGPIPPCLDLEASPLLPTNE
jgi:hypothetical protein